MKKLAIITTHPIQYNAPWFKLLEERGLVKPKVFYTWSQSKDKKYDPGFDKNIEWDISLLEGYEYTFVKNTSSDPGSHHFNGIMNPELIDAINLWKPNAILVFGWAFKSHLKCLRYFHKKIPVLFRGDSTLLGSSNFIKKIARHVFLKWVYSHVSYALYTGKQNKLYFKKFGLKEKQLIFAPHAIDNDRFADETGNAQQAAEKWKREIGIEPHELTVLYAGKFEEIKNPFFIIDLAKRLQHLPVKFIMVGNGPLEKQLKQQAADNSKIKFIDFQNQQMMPLVYRLADIFLLPSKSETWGLSVNEAMACAKPVAVSDTCGCAADLIKHGVNGYVFNPKKTDEFIKNIKELISNKDKAKEMGNKSLEIIRSYSFINIAEPLELLLINNT